MSEIYVHEQSGADRADVTGTEKDPYQTPAFALFKHPDSKILVYKKVEDSEEYKYGEISSSALKKAKKGADGLKKKEERAAKLKKEQEAREKEAAKRLAEAELIDIVEDKSLPAASKTKLLSIQEKVGQRIAVSGWVHRLRLQKGLAFITLRDGSGFLQCVLSGDMVKARQTQELTLESTILVKGVLNKLPDGKSAPGGVELKADYYEVIGLAPSGEDAFTNKVQEGADPSLLLDLRHLALRGESLSAVMKVRSSFLAAIRSFYIKEHIREVTPPCMVQSQVEGGSTLFKMDYYGQEAFLTQSSQLYLETCLPSLGDVYCIQESFRAEKSHTRRHLSEYTHIEAELAFIDFDDLLSHIERLIVSVVTYVLEDPVSGPLIQQLNPGFNIPKTPFMRMKYVDALKWLNEHGIKNEEDQEFKFGDDIAEAAERKMVDTIDHPILLTHFPVEIKSFYMQKDPEDLRVTESVDLLMPNVGEVTGGSMRIKDYDELMAAIKREGLDADSYAFLTDQRKYGTSPHGGYGLGTERILAWLCDRFTVRDCSLYPRFTGRCKP